MTSAPSLISSHQSRDGAYDAAPTAEHLLPQRHDDPLLHPRLSAGQTGSSRKTSPSPGGGTAQTTGSGFPLPTARGRRRRRRPPAPRPRRPAGSDGAARRHRGTRSSARSPGTQQGRPEGRRSAATRLSTARSDQPEQSQAAEGLGIPASPIAPPPRARRPGPATGRRSTHRPLTLFRQADGRLPPACPVDQVVRARTSARSRAWHPRAAIRRPAGRPTKGLGRRAPDAPIPIATRVHARPTRRSIEPGSSSSSSRILNRGAPAAAVTSTELKQAQGVAIRSPAGRPWGPGGAGCKPTGCGAGSVAGRRGGDLHGAIPDRAGTSPACASPSRLRPPAGGGRRGDRGSPRDPSGSLQARERVRRPAMG